MLLVTSGASTLAAVLGSLAEQLRLQGEDVIEDAIDSPAFEAMVGDHTRPLELGPQQTTQGPVDPRLSAYLRLFEQLKAAVECQLPLPVLANAHVPNTSTLPVEVTRTLT